MLGFGCMATLILNPSTVWRLLFSCTPLPLDPREDFPWYPTNIGNSRRWEEEKNVLLLPGSKPVLLGRPARRLMSIPTELHRLPGSTDTLSEPPNVSIISLHFCFYIYWQWPEKLPYYCNFHVYLHGANRKHPKILLNDAPKSIGLLWTSDQFVAEKSAWQHTTLTWERLLCPRRNKNPQSQQTWALDHAATETGVSAV
jgi:hypothetical protein